MRGTIVRLFIVLSVTSAAYGQVMTAPMSYYSFSGSDIDHNGSLLVFDAMYSYPVPAPVQGLIVRSLPSVKTRVTVITSDGKKMNPVEYDGAFQLIGVGAHAVYAIATTYKANSTTDPSSGSTTTPVPVITYTTTRRLVALNAVAGVLTASLPTIDLPLRTGVKLATAPDDTVADTLSLVDGVPNPMILAPTATAPGVQRFAQIIKYLGGATFDASIKPIPLE